MKKKKPTSLKWGDRERSHMVCHGIFWSGQFVDVFSQLISIWHSNLVFRFSPFPLSIDKNHLIADDFYLLATPGFKYTRNHTYVILKGRKV